MLCVEIWWTGNLRRHGIKNMALIFKNMASLPKSWNSNLYKINSGETKTACMLYKALCIVCYLNSSANMASKRGNTSESKQTISLDPYICNKWNIKTNNINLFYINFYLHLQTLFWKHRVRIVTKLLDISYLCDGVWAELMTGFGIFLWPLSLCITSRRLILGNQA
jgi:fucose permease